MIFLFLICRFSDIKGKLTIEHLKLDLTLDVQSPGNIGNLTWLCVTCLDLSSIPGFDVRWRLSEKISGTKVHGEVTPPSFRNSKEHASGFMLLAMLLGIFPRSISIIWE